MHKIKTEFSLTEPTNVGGSKVFLEYLEKIKLADALKTPFCGKAGKTLFPVWDHRGHRPVVSKYGFSIDRIATGSFEANEIDLLVKLMAYNLYERFKRDGCDSVHRSYTISRFCLEFFHCAGR